MSLSGHGLHTYVAATFRVLADANVRIVGVLWTTILAEKQVISLSTSYRDLPYMLHPIILNSRRDFVDEWSRRSGIIVLIVYWYSYSRSLPSVIAIRPYANGVACVHWRLAHAHLFTDGLSHALHTVNGQTGPCFEAWRRWLHYSQRHLACRSRYVRAWGASTHGYP